MKASGKSAAHPQHFVHSKVMTWVAFDRAAQNDTRQARKGALPPLADQIHKDICAKGVDKKRGCFVQAYGSQPHGRQPAAAAAGGFSAGQGQAHQKDRAGNREEAAVQGPGAAL